ncbi:hypothetical protein GGD41_006414 [Paraburkholderia bryophila]|uniref:Uncharacterized protein n=1 Tax=Paraburkholderia bryophila TaxID=420952 RepID=A0A7Y9WFB9_9BURK|nr:hypothetical protein [Paraburkholderia bryophila]
MLHALGRLRNGPGFHAVGLKAAEEGGREVALMCL